MDAINRLAGAARLDQMTVDDAAQQLARADLPTASAPDPTNPVAPKPLDSKRGATADVDVAGQLVAMNVAVDMHHVTTAALRSAFSMYRDSIDLLRSTPNADS